MNLYNTRTKNVGPFTPLAKNTVRLYSCGPTVYDHVHIGNLASFIFADTLRRALHASGYNVHHAMNITDVDDKTIRRGRAEHPDLEPIKSLKLVTAQYEQAFFDDIKSVGNDLEAVQFIRATDSIDDMRTLITRLHKQGIAYIADDGIYFSISAYQKNRTYGQLTEVSIERTSEARIQNDEYDKDAAQDFALWKRQKDGEPAWPFELDGKDLTGRPGWHIECSAMSVGALGQPFDIHTGGVDLIFPHHENEIAQSTAGSQPELYANFFCHNEHVLVDGKKMSKSLRNFFTLVDVAAKTFEPLAFRLLVLQSHYRHQLNFTWESLDAAQRRLHDLRAMADLRWQYQASKGIDADALKDARQIILTAMQDDLNSPQALAALSQIEQAVQTQNVSKVNARQFETFLGFLDELFGLQILQSTDITKEQKIVIARREKAREHKDFETSDKLRHELIAQGIGLRDTADGPIWYRL